MKVGVCIVGVPERQEYIQKMLIDLPVDTAVMLDYDHKGCWFNARRSWLHLGNMDVDYGLCLLDDLELCNDFMPTVTRVLQVAQNKPVSFFNMRRKATEQAIAKKVHWCCTSYPLMSQAWAFTPGRWKHAVSWIDQHILDDEAHRNYYDDFRFAIYCLVHKIKVYYTVPCLVEHLGYNDSLIGIKGTVGKNKRVASLFMKDVSDINFARGIDKPIDDGMSKNPWSFDGVIP